MIQLWRTRAVAAPIRVIAAILFATAMLGILTTFSRSPASTTGRLSWRQEIISCATSNATVVKIPVYYDGSARNLWSMNMTPAQCMRHLR
jgi:hypothetical protein